MQRSSNRNPCPCCGRTKTSHCAWTINGGDEDVVLCHAGERWGPPAGLKIGDLIDISGRPWALTAIDKGFAGSSHVFKPHRGNTDKIYSLPRRIRAANAKLLQAEPLNQKNPHTLWVQLYRDAKVALDPVTKHQDAVTVFSSLELRCKHLLTQLRRTSRADPTLRPYVDDATSLLRVLRYEHQHALKCLESDSYREALGDCCREELALPQSDAAYWQQQKALPNHPWVVECLMAGQPFWFPVEGKS